MIIFKKIENRLCTNFNTKSFFLKSFLEKYIYYTNLKKINKIVRHSNAIKLDLGCGKLKRDGFIGLDIEPVSTLQWNVVWGLPFGDEQVLEIRSDHFFEHLHLVDIVSVFKECHRVLVKDGTLDFTIPHIDPYIEAYLRRDFEFLKEKINDIPKNQECFYSTCFDRISWLLHRDGEHCSLFDKESILAKLEFAGFQKTYVRDYRPEKDMNQRFSSIYVVGIK